MVGSTRRQSFENSLTAGPSAPSRRPSVEEEVKKNSKLKKRTSGFFGSRKSKAVKSTDVPPASSSSTSGDHSGFFETTGRRKSRIAVVIPASLASPSLLPPLATLPAIPKVYNIVRPAPPPLTCKGVLTEEAKSEGVESEAILTPNQLKNVEEEEEVEETSFVEARKKMERLLGGTVLMSSPTGQNKVAPIESEVQKEVVEQPQSFEEKKKMLEKLLAGGREAGK